MDFLLIGESKIKIVLNRDERKNYALVGNEINSADGRRGFWRLINQAREQVGFDPGGDKLLIQLYPTGESLEIFVTKLGILPDSSARMVARSDRVSLLLRKKNYYSFDSLDELILAAKAVRKNAPEVNIDSDVYLLSDRYFLSVDEYGKGGEGVEFPSILEFATPVTAELSSYIIEHSTHLTNGDGIEKFSSL